MKLDRTPLSRPEKVSSLASDDGIVEVDNMEKKEIQERPTVQDIVVTLNSCILSTCDTREDDSNEDRDSEKLKPNRSVFTAMEIINENMKRLGSRNQYRDIFSVDLSNESLQTVEESVSYKLTRLVSLDLSNNKLFSLPDVLEFKSLQSLNISHNSFSSVPVCVQAYCAKLVHLDMSHNRIKVLDQPKCTFFGLKKFIINNNDNMRIPEWFWYTDFQSLEELDVSFTDPFFQSLPIWLLNYMEMKQRGAFQNLIVVRAQNSGIHMSNVDQMQTLKQVKYLDCSNVSLSSSIQNANVMWEIPPSILQLATLLELHLSSCHVNHIPEDISNLACLELLDLSHNKLFMLPKSITKLEMLKELDLSHNQLLELPARIEGLRNLTKLRAQFNCISTLPSECNQLPLEYCDLYNNQLQPDCLPILTGMATLHSLDLMLNHMSPELVPSNLQKNLRDSLPDSHKRLNVAVDSSSSEEPETNYYSGYESFNSSRCPSPIEFSPGKDNHGQQPVSSPSIWGDSWDNDVATPSDVVYFNATVGSSLRTPKNYDEAIECFRMKDQRATSFIPGDSQLRFSKSMKRRHLVVNRRIVPGQFDPAE